MTCKAKTNAQKPSSMGWEADEAKGAVAVEENCILVNRIRGRQYVEEIIDHIKTDSAKQSTRHH